MGVELGRGVAFNGAGRVVLEGRGGKLARRLRCAGCCRFSPGYTAPTRTGPRERSPGAPLLPGRRRRPGRSMKPTSARKTSHPIRPGVRRWLLPCQTSRHRSWPSDAGLAAPRSAVLALLRRAKCSAPTAPARPTLRQACPAIRYGPAGRGSSSSAHSKQTPARGTSAPGLPRVVARWKA